MHKVDADAGEAEAALNALLNDDALKLRILDSCESVEATSWKKCQPTAFSDSCLAMATAGQHCAVPTAAALLNVCPRRAFSAPHPCSQPVSAGVL
jgi:hypothetical protein